MDRLFQLTTKNLLGALNLVLVIVCAYVAARMVHNLRQPAPELRAATISGRLVSPPATPGRTFIAYKPILDRNLFKSALTEAVVSQAELEVPEVVEESPLQAKLVATIVASEDHLSTATIEDLSQRKRAVYRVDDPLMGEATVVRIERERVIVLRKGAHEKLSLYDEEGETPKTDVLGRRSQARPDAAGGSLRRDFTPLPRGGAATGAMSAVSDFNSKNNQFRVMPNFAQGQMKGFRIFAVSPNSQWAKSGLRNGDIINSINGREVTSGSSVEELLGELAGAAAVELAVTRGNQQQQIRYEGDS